ncbi:hypothetical protein GSH19_01795 [Lactobacillus sp. S2-2]|uniref:hypothetical protein n=1 Tax=Lactobacillus sp. S2-2 TaxID=2692917 RepID=UPI001F307574|nr:hypothetical protein [Lactobacillus sp. S2-2]MCF6514896.1 hypothetical protein [Lactobacillus sp. S2-2]
MDSIEEIINQANILYNQGNYSGAKKLLNPLLEENMSEVIIKLYLKILFGLQEYEEGTTFSEEHISLLEFDNEFTELFIDVHLKNEIFLGILPFIKDKVLNSKKYVDYVLTQQKVYIKNNQDKINKIVKKLKHLSNYDDFFEVQRIIESMQQLSYKLLKDALSITLVDEDLNLLIRNIILIKLRTFYFDDNLNVLSYYNEIVTVNPNKLSGYTNSKFMIKLNNYLDEKIVQGELIYSDVKEFLNEEMKLFYPFFDFDLMTLIDVTKRQVVYGDAIEYIKILKSQENNVDKINKLDKIESIFQIIEETKNNLIKQFD